VLIVIICTYWRYANANHLLLFLGATRSDRRALCAAAAAAALSRLWRMPVASRRKNQDTIILALGGLGGFIDAVLGLIVAARWKWDAIGR